MENLDKVYAKKIAEEYQVKTERKTVQLKKLDEKVKKPAFIFALTSGIIYALIMGCGMSMILTDFGPQGNLKYVLGVILGVIGLAMCVANYFIYQRILKSRKLKYGSLITTLANEIIDEK